MRVFENYITNEDIVTENYIRLAISILQPNDGLGVSLANLYNREEEKKRMKEIDELRKRGLKTECEIIQSGWGRWRKPERHNVDDYVRSEVKQPNIPYSDIEKAFIVQMTPHLTHQEIADILGRPKTGINYILGRIKKTEADKLDYYNNLDVVWLFRKEKNEI